MLERLLGEALSSDAPLGSHRSVMSRAAIAAGIRIARAHLLAGQHDRLPELTKPFSDWLSALRNGEPSLEARSPRRGGSVGDRDHLSRRLAVSAGDDRQLLLVAATKLVLREGYAALTAPAIRREAGVSRRIFEQYFEGHADCFLTAVDSLIFEAFDRAEKEAAAARSWDRRVARTLEHLMAGLAHQPAMARLVLVEMLRPGICGLMRREDIVRRLAERLQGAAPAGARLGHVSAEASVAGAWHIAEMQVADGRVDRLRDLTGRMAYVVLAPTIGAGAAERAILSVAGNTRA
jgi:AcrR family transcriptional regulator